MHDTMIAPPPSSCCNFPHPQLVLALPSKREGIRAVIAALETSPRLRCLSLAGCQLGGDGGQAIIKAIGSGRELFRLLDLDLSHNSLGAGSGEALAAAVGRNETLTRLSLRCATLLRCFFRRLRCRCRRRRVNRHQSIEAEMLVYMLGKKSHCQRQQHVVVRTARSRCHCMCGCCLGEQTRTGRG